MSTWFWGVLGWFWGVLGGFGVFLGIFWVFFGYFGCLGLVVILSCVIGFWVLRFWWVLSVLVLGFEFWWVCGAGDCPVGGCYLWVCFRC